MKIRTYPDPIDASQWGHLSAAVCQEPMIMASRNTAEHLKNLYEGGFAVVLVDGEQIVGFKAAWPVEDGYLEVGSVWVRNDLRGQGLSHKLYEAIVQLPSVRESVTFGITKNIRSVRAGAHVGFMTLTDWTDPIPWRLTCEPCDCVAPEDLESCEERNRTCHLRVLRKCPHYGHPMPMR